MSAATTFSIRLQALGDRQDVVVSEALALLAVLTEAGWVRRRSLLAVLAADSARVRLPPFLTNASQISRLIARILLRSSVHRRGHHVVDGGSTPPPSHPICLISRCSLAFHAPGS